MAPPTAAPFQNPQDTLPKLSNAAALNPNAGVGTSPRAPAAGLAPFQNTPTPGQNPPTAPAAQSPFQQNPPPYPPGWSWQGQAGAPGGPYNAPGSPGYWNAVWENMMRRPYQEGNAPTLDPGWASQNPILADWAKNSPDNARWLAARNPAELQWLEMNPRQTPVLLGTLPMGQTYQSMSWERFDPSKAAPLMGLWNRLSPDMQNQMRNWAPPYIDAYFKGMQEGDQAYMRQVADAAGHLLSYRDRYNQAVERYNELAKMMENQFQVAQYYYYNGPQEIMPTYR